VGPEWRATEVKKAVLDRKRLEGIRGPASSLSRSDGGEVKGCHKKKRRVGLIELRLG